MASLRDMEPGERTNTCDDRGTWQKIRNDPDGEHVWMAPVHAARIGKTGKVFKPESVGKEEKVNKNGEWKVPGKQFFNIPDMYEVIETYALVNVTKQRANDLHKDENKVLARQTENLIPARVTFRLRRDDPRITLYR